LIYPIYIGILLKYNMGKHKKSKAKENKDKKAQRKKPIEREFTGRKFVRQTHTVQGITESSINTVRDNRVEFALTHEESILQQMMFQNTDK